jgi:hypothetical protein
MQAPPVTPFLPYGDQNSADDPQMAVYYNAAKNTYLKAASLTACPERAIVLRKYVLWCDCQIARLKSNTPTPECEEPNYPIPDCSGDLVGAAPFGDFGNTAAATASPYGTDPVIQDALDKLQNILQHALMNGEEPLDDSTQQIMQQLLDESKSNEESVGSASEISYALVSQLNKMQGMTQNGQNGSPRATGRFIICTCPIFSKPN